MQPFYGSAMVALDVISDNICLLLMFSEYDNVYNCLCKSCNICCIKCVFGRSYDHQSLSVTVNNDVINQEKDDDNTRDTYL